MLTNFLLLLFFPKCLGLLWLAMFSSLDNVLLSVGALCPLFPQSLPELHGSGGKLSVGVHAGVASREDGE